MQTKLKTLTRVYIGDIVNRIDIQNICIVDQVEEDTKIELIRQLIHITKIVAQVEADTKIELIRQLINITKIIKSERLRIIDQVLGDGDKIMEPYKKAKKHKKTNKSITKFKL